MAVDGPLWVPGVLGGVEGFKSALGALSAVVEIVCAGAGPSLAFRMNGARVPSAFAILESMCSDRVPASSCVSAVMSGVVGVGDATPGWTFAAAFALNVAVKAGSCDEVCGTAVSLEISATPASTSNRVGSSGDSVAVTRLALGAFALLEI
ncbi:MAG TPA: hypothetical protein VEJ46_13015 [Candidatus Acidoferrum sp.]|nr:hypothetical protein [Candidatus Acidoferrum sp.]